MRKNRKITPMALKKLSEGKVKTLSIEEADLFGRYLARNALHPETGEVLLPANTELSKEKVEELRTAGVKEIDLLFIDGDHTYAGVKKDYEMY